MHVELTSVYLLMFQFRQYIGLNNEGQYDVDFNELEKSTYKFIHTFLNNIQEFLS